MGFTVEVNDWVASFCRGRESRLVPVGSVHPRFTHDPRGEVDRLVDLGIEALKIHPPHMLFAPNAYRDGGDCPALAAIYERASEKRLPVIVHTGTSIFRGARNKYADPMAVDDVAVDFPDLPIVLAHGGRPLYMETCFFLLRRHRSLFLEISGIPPGRLLDYFPRLEEMSSRVIWGTDWPSPGVPSMSGNARAFLGLPLPDEARRAILANTARAVYGIIR
jgi:predicted TIM-barrel fold metal-dependent hydrolase